jgi:guanosine-3',5'-bis(diphosphate) 3'-pyrophosphohydrolase
MLEKEARRQGYDIYQLIKFDFMNNLLKRMSFTNVEDMYAAIGYGAITTKQILQKILDEFRKNIKPDKSELITAKIDTKSKTKKKVDRGIKIDGIGNLLVKFSRCCNPVPGDKIVGYVTRGRGVSIHRQDCKNVRRGLLDEDRLMEVKWEGFEDTSYPVEIQASAYDRSGILSEIINLIGDMKTNIDAVNARATKNGIAVVDLIVQVLPVMCTSSITSIYHE